ncbi:MAG: recombination mediator RecR [bacterium]
MSRPQSLDQLITALQHLPGVGPRSAQRMAESIIRMDYERARDIARSIVRVKKDIHPCSVCFNHTEQDPCVICANTDRDSSFICVVEASEDVIAFERAKSHPGVYHVLGGTIHPTKGLGPDRIRLQELFNRVQKGGIKELLIATNPSLEGETTASYIMENLKTYGVRITRPARGLPRGADLDYLDSDTISHAYQARQEIKSGD